MTFQQEHRGSWGDLEWYTTPTSTIFPRFYSNTGTGRDQVAVEAASAIQTNNTYCKFGRTSGYSCDFVKLTSVNVTFGGYTHYQLVAMQSNKSIPGDSGGPWFISTTAAGIQSGYATINGVNYDTWSKADYLNAALGVVVLIK